MLIKEIKAIIRNSQNVGFFHDSKADVRTLTRTCNKLISKVNELVLANNEQQKEIEKLKRINELNYSTFKSVKEWDYIPANWLATELGLNIEKSES